MLVKRLNVDGKPLAYKNEVTNHTSDTNVHTTVAEKTAWNSKQDALQYYDEPTATPHSAVIGDTDTNATITLKCGNTTVVLNEAALVKLNQLLNCNFIYPENN